MNKYKERHHPDSCFNKADEDEMLFVLREKDPAMAATVRFWINKRIELGINRFEDPKIQEALKVAIYVADSEYCDKSKVNYKDVLETEAKDFT